jgi:sulfonate dioxygenase
MAPFLEEASQTQTSPPNNHITLKAGKSSVQNYVPGRTPSTTYDNYEHEDLRPRFPDLKWEPLTEIPYTDKGLKGDPNFKNLLSSATDVFDYNPKIGTEIHGVRLTQLNEAQKDDLARLIATRGVVFFRNQDDFDIDAHRDFMRHYGQLHKHATTAMPKREGLEDVHVVYTGEDSKEMRAVFTPTFLWHSDVSLTSNLQMLAFANK